MDDTELGNAGDALTAFANGPVLDAGQSIERSLSRSFAALEKAIVQATTRGKLSVKDMVDSMLRELNRVAIRQFVAQPLASAVSNLVSAVLPVAGARADGGLVSAGQTYLVGERGPELFVPGSSGRIAASGSAGQARAQVALHVTATDAASFLRSEGQVAAMMLRALKRGKRNL